MRLARPERKRPNTSLTLFQFVLVEFCVHLPPMKSPILIVILGFILFSVVGYYPMFKLEQASIRHAVKTRLKNGVSDEDLHYIVFESEEDIQWTRVDKEFRLGDRMFDVVRRKEGKQLAFYCINDVEEGLLFKNLEETVANSLGDPKSPVQKSGKIVLRLLKVPSPIFTAEIDLPTFGENQKVLTEYQNLYSGNFARLSTPPPQV